MYFGLQIIFSILRRNVLYFFNFQILIFRNCNTLACALLESSYNHFIVLLHFSTKAELTFEGIRWNNKIFSLLFLSLWVALSIAPHFQISPGHLASTNCVTINTPL